jgi:hypothetical protein
LSRSWKVGVPAVTGPLFRSAKLAYQLHVILLPLAACQGRRATWPQGPVADHGARLIG